MKNIKNIIFDLGGVIINLDINKTISEFNKISEVKFELNDVAHTFKEGHKIMVQVQSSWFPLVDRNPQKFMRIPEANESDFQKVTIRIYYDGTNNSKIVLPVLNK